MFRSVSKVAWRTYLALAVGSPRACTSISVASPPFSQFVRSTRCFSKIAPGPTLTTVSSAESAQPRQSAGIVEAKGVDLVLSPPALVVTREFEVCDTT